ncbi:methyltransferase domain-containing protein, partial [Klebsiella pneumoniae]|uniref:methyltransferase domain-containing protein n=1 Tax=Klebsiella pneumoniae TaxID=573 RepID=UPI003852DBEC
TGWFYDHRANRARIADIAHGARVLDLYCHTGGFALAAAKAGAAEVVGVDASGFALGLANQAAAENGVAETTKFIEANVFDEATTALLASGKFDIVV